MSRLTLEEIKKITFGAIKIEEKENGINFSRLSENQVKIFGEMNKFMGYDAICTTGIRLDFETDGTALDFTVGSKGKYEVLIDGVIRHRKIAEENESVTVALNDTFGNQKDKKRVTLVLPSHDYGTLRNVEIANSTFVTPRKFKSKILFLGDSITQGWDTFFNTTSYAWRLALSADADFINQGIGRTFFFPDGLEKTDFAPDKIFVSYGTNDYNSGNTIEKFENNVSGYLDKITGMYPQAEITVISPIWRRAHTGLPLGSLEDLIKIIRLHTEKRGLRYVDGALLVPPIEEFYIADCLHPNDLGMASYAENLYRLCF